MPRMPRRCPQKKGLCLDFGWYHRLLSDKISAHCWSTFLILVSTLVRYINDNRSYSKLTWGYPQIFQVIDDHFQHFWVPVVQRESSNSCCFVAETWVWKCAIPGKLYHVIPWYIPCYAVYPMANFTGNITGTGLTKTLWPVIFSQTQGQKIQPKSHRDNVLTTQVRSLTARGGWICSAIAKGCNTTEELGKSKEISLSMDE